MNSRQITAAVVTAAMITMFAACGNANTMPMQQQSTYTFDDSTPSKLVESLADAIKAQAWDDIPKFYSGEDKPTMVGEDFRKNLVKLAEIDSVGDSYEEESNGETYAVVPFTINGYEDEAEVVQSPEGGWRIDRASEVLTYLDDSDGVCIKQVLDNADSNLYVLPGEYSVTCSTQWGLKAKQTLYYGVEGKNRVEYSDWPSKTDLIQQAKDALEKGINGGAYIHAEYSNGEEADLSATELTSDIDVQDVGIAGNTVWAKAVFNFSYERSGVAQEWIDDGAGMWWSLNVLPEGLAAVSENGSTEITARNPDNIPDDYKSVLK